MPTTRSSKYWQDRFTKLEESQMQKGMDYYASLDREYKLANARIEKEIQAWYARFAANNQITMSEARKWLTTKELEEFKWDVDTFIEYGRKNADQIDPLWMKQLENASAKFHITRLESLKIQTQHQVEVLFGNQVDGIDQLARNIYKEGYYHTAFEIQNGLNIGYDLGRLNERQIAGVIAKPWTSDNKTFKARCWNSKADLVNTVHTELTQTIIRGDAPDRAIKNIAHKFQVTKHQAGRLVMTESAFFASAAQKAAYTDLNVERFEVVATLDMRTSEICQSLDGQVIEMKDYAPGITAPPFHVYCRSCTAPYFDDNIGKRIARNTDGETYLVPSNLKYPDWFEAFVNGGSKSAFDEVDPISIVVSNEALENLKESIWGKHDKFLTPVHNDELRTFLDQMDEGQLTFYDKLSDRFDISQYYGGNGWYVPIKKRVEMSMDANSWERRMGIGDKYTGAFMTKFHEEFHQLDHILSTTDFAKDAAGDVLRWDWAFTSPNTVIGGKMAEAIQQDVLDVVNAAITWLNEVEGTKVKPLKNLNRIPSDAYRAFFKYLKDKYPGEKGAASIYMFTDAAGLSTKDRLAPHPNGFWGHNSKYNKERGLRGATSETWATFGGMKMMNNQEVEAGIMELMPNTMKVYDEAYQQVLEYAKDNDLNY